MGCKISKKSEPIEAAIQDIPSLRKPEQNMEDSDQAFAYQPKQNDPLPRPVEKSREIITKENDITIKASELVGEKKGNILDSYTFEKNLGAGAFGEVKRAKHKLTGIIRAIKIIKKAGMSESEIQDLKNEIEILRKLDHPHILRVFEYFADKQSIFLVTEFCSGGELFERIVEAGFFSEKRASRIMYQILLAINYCHKNNVVHRDLKPENILYETRDPESPLKIIDFGTAGVFNPNKKLEENVGTCYYVAPEVLKEKYDYKCDLWSCGVIMYILLCGYPPFRGDTDEEILENVRIGKYNLDEPEFETISIEGKNLLKKLMTYDPAKRITAEQALQDAWIKRFEELPDKPLISKALMNMKNFRAERKIQVAAYTFLTNFLALNDEKKDLLKTFQSLDKNGDGQLTTEELLAGYRQTMDKATAEEMVTKIMESCDVDKSGKIDYNEFLMATLNREKLLSKERLDKAFKMFDSDGNGYISSNEFKAIFCGDDKIPITVWDEMIKGVDENGDGKISYEEFSSMMQKLIEK